MLVLIDVELRATKKAEGKREELKDSRESCSEGKAKLRSNSIDMASFEGGKTINLISGDDQTFSVPINIVMISGFIKNIAGEMTEGGEIKIHPVSGAILAKVLEFCKHYSTEPMKVLEKVLILYDQSICSSLTLRNVILKDL